MTRALAAIAVLLLLPQGVAAQSAGGEPSASDLAKQTQNPIASLISFPLQTNWDMGVGDRQATSTLLNIQPVMPFAISKTANVIIRAIVPLTSQPSSGTDGNRISGLGDIVLSTFFSSATAGRVIWGAGPVLLLPTATNGALGSEKIGIGPTAVALIQPSQWTIGLLFFQAWSTSGANDREDINKTYLQPFLAYNLGDGLSVGVQSEATANWKADKDKWSGPVLFDVSKVTKIGKPVRIRFAAGPSFGPASGPNWRFRFEANFLFPR